MSHRLACAANLCRRLAKIRLLLEASASVPFRFVSWARSLGDDRMHVIYLRPASSAVGLDSREEGCGETAALIFGCSGHDCFFWNVRTVAG